MMSDLLIAFGAAFVLILGTFVFATHMTLYQDYKYYKPTFKLLNQLNDGSKIKMLGDYLTIKLDNEPEIIFFEGGAIKMGYDTYIHNSFYEIFSPYTLYYHYKFSKIKPHLIYMYNRARRNTLEETSFESYFRDSQLTKSKELHFKFLRG